MRGDVLDAASLPPALEGVHTAYYLVHSMASGADFEERDRAGARIFARAARRQGVRRVIYLGGLGGDGRLSPHLASRLQVGMILAAEGPPTLEFRTSIIIGSGSLSFELIRHLVNRLPVMVTPRWVRTRTQPIFIDDVVSYLILGLDLEEDGSAVFEIGGPRRLSYGQLMSEYARQVGLRRLMIPVPLLSPRVSGLWLGLVTPLHARIGRKLVDSLRNETIVRDASAMARFPVPRLGVGDAIAWALREEDVALARTRWSDPAALNDGRGRAHGRGDRRIAARLVDCRRARAAVSPSRAFAPIQRIGGDRGWYCATWLWRLRGLIDRMLGGVGMRRGRRHPVELRAGDPLDFWRVEDFEPGRLLRLRAEMKLPGRAWLQFEVEPADGGSRITQTAIFDPRGLGGLLYWYALYPVHWIIFRGMLRGIVDWAEGRSADRVAAGSSWMSPHEHRERRGPARAGARYDPPAPSACDKKATARGMASPRPKRS